MPAELTDKGRELLARAERAVAAVDQQVLAGLTVTEQHQLKSLLAKAGEAHRKETNCSLATPGA